MILMMSFVLACGALAVVVIGVVMIRESIFYESIRGCDLCFGVRGSLNLPDCPQCGRRFGARRSLAQGKDPRE